jgi:hypothetical protein
MHVGICVDFVNLILKRAAEQVRRIVQTLPHVGDVEHRLCLGREQAEFTEKRFTGDDFVSHGNTSMNEFKNNYIMRCAGWFSDILRFLDNTL